MGYVELRDGIANRRIWVPELRGSVEIDVTVPGEPAVTVHDEATVRRERA